MGMKRRPGRPKMAAADRRDAMFYIRLTHAERRAFERAAHREGFTIAEWLRRLAHAAIARKDSTP